MDKEPEIFFRNTHNFTKMKRILTLLLLFIGFASLIAQNSAKSDNPMTPNVIVKLDGTQTSWLKIENDEIPNAVISGNENVSYIATANGIFITIINGTNKIKLFALTGQLLLDGNLKQGRFFIPTHQGIYILKVNNKSYKVVCK